MYFIMQLNNYVLAYALQRVFYNKALYIWPDSLVYKGISFHNCDSFYASHICIKSVNWGEP